MRHMSRLADITRSHAGRGEIHFSGGARIQTHFKLTEYITGPARLAWTGLFTQASYRGWEHLVHQYRLGPGRTAAQARQRGLVARFAGHKEDYRPLT